MWQCIGSSVPLVQIGECSHGPRVNLGHAEVRDRALLYYRLLHTSPADAEEVVHRSVFRVWGDDL